MDIIVFGCIVSLFASPARKILRNRLNYTTYRTNPRPTSARFPICTSPRPRALSRNFHSHRLPFQRPQQASSPFRSHSLLSPASHQACSLLDRREFPIREKYENACCSLLRRRLAVREVRRVRFRDS